MSTSTGKSIYRGIKRILSGKETPSGSFMDRVQAYVDRVRKVHDEGITGFDARKTTKTNYFRANRFLERWRNS